MVRSAFIFFLTLLSISCEANEPSAIVTTSLPVSFREYLDCKFGKIAENVCEKKYHNYEYSALPSNIRSQIADEKYYVFYFLPSLSNLSVLLAIDGESDTNEYFLHVFKDGYLASTEEVGTSDGKNVISFEINKDYVITINKMIGTTNKVKKSTHKKIGGDGKIVACTSSGLNCD
jgi:hypothetical protein